MASEIRNARIKHVSLSMADYGCLTYVIALDGGGVGCVYGGIVLGKGYLGAKEFEGSSKGLEALMRIMDVVGVKRWEDLIGKYVRFVNPGCGGNGAMFGYTLDATQTNEWLEETKLPYGKDVFVSIEPIQGEINSYYLDHILKCGWVIVGAETGNRKGIIKPKKEWIDFIMRHCEANKIPIFMKESLRGLMGDDFQQEFPWGGDANER